MPLVPTNKRLGSEGVVDKAKAAHRSEPPRVLRRLLGLSQAANAGLYADPYR